MPKVGEIVTGVIFEILDKIGAKVRLSEKETGFIHISEVSNDFVRNVKDYLKVGQEVKVKVISVDKKRNRISLSIKQLDDDEGKKKAIFEAKMIRFMKDSNDKLKQIQRNKESKQGIKKKNPKKK